MPMYVLSLSTLLLSGHLTLKKALISLKMCSDASLNLYPNFTTYLIQPAYPASIYQLFLVAVLISISALSTASCITIPAWIHLVTSLFVLNLSLVVIHLLFSNHLLDLTLVNFLFFLVLLTFGILYLLQLSLQALSLLSRLV